MLSVEFTKPFFYTDDAHEYLSMWTEELALFQCFAWVDLRSITDWTTVKKSFKILAEKTSFDFDAQSSAVFDQFVFVKNYCANEKINKWNANNVSTEARWVEMFKYFESKHVPFNQFSAIVEYVLCFPGSSAPVERLFAKANKVWKQESTNLHIKTLRAILFVKSNMEYTCTEFHRYLKTRPEILRKISSQEKYEFKQVKLNENISPGAMSISTIDSD